VLAAWDSKPILKLYVQNGGTVTWLPISSLELLKGPGFILAKPESVSATVIGEENGQPWMRWLPASNITLVDFVDTP